MGTFLKLIQTLPVVDISKIIFTTSLLNLLFYSRDHPDVLAGYGTIALEILHEIPEVDAIIVPIGTGGLAAATARVVKHHNTKCQVYVRIYVYYIYLCTSTKVSQLPNRTTIKCQQNVANNK